MKRKFIFFMILCSLPLFAHGEGVLNTQGDNIYEDAGISKFPVESVLPDGRSYHVFSHGRPGELLLDGEWRNVEQIASFLKSRLSPGTSQVNLYGCEFGKGQRGKAAVERLEAMLGVSVSASDDITGKDGDWDLEVGLYKSFNEFGTYDDNLQCAADDDTQIIGPTATKNANGYTTTTYLHTAGTVLTPLTGFDFTVQGISASTGTSGIYWANTPRLTAISNSISYKGGTIIFNKPYQGFYLYVGGTSYLNNSLTGDKTETARVTAYDVNGNVILYTSISEKGSTQNSNNTTVTNSNGTTTVASAAPSSGKSNFGYAILYYAAPVSKISITASYYSENNSGNDATIDFSFKGGCVNNTCATNTTAPVVPDPATYYTACSSGTFNLNSVNVSGCSSGTQVQWHTANTNLYSGTQVSNPAAVPAGTYYAVCYNTTSGCYSKASGPVTVTDYQQAPAPAPVNDLSDINNPETTVQVSILSNDVLSDGKIATTTTCAIALTTTGLPSGSTLNGDGSVTAAGEGTWTYDGTAGKLSFAPLGGFKKNPTPLTYTLSENYTCKTSQAAVTVKYQGALPVTLLSFTASEATEGVLLKWRTAEEKNFDRFEIEFSELPQAGFQRIATVYGGSSDYTYPDVGMRTGAVYYRLKMIDLDGTYAYSRIVTVSSRNGVELNKVYPNPSNGRIIRIAANGPAESLTVFDTSGRSIRTQVTVKNGFYEIALGKGPTPGIYVIRYKAGGKMFSDKFVLSE